MRKLDRYIVKSVASATLLVLLVLISLDLVFGLINELDEARNQYQAPQALLYILYTLPRRVYDYLPLAAFMGSLIGLGALANSSQLVVIRAAGVSLLRIVWMAMKPALLVVMLGLLLGEYIAPRLEVIAQSTKTVARSGQDNIASNAGLWHREANQFIHINAIQPDGGLLGVSIFTFNPKTNWLDAAAFARQARFMGTHWQLESVRTTRLTPTQTDQDVQPQVRWDSGLTPDLLKILVVDPDNLAISGLYQYANYLDQQGLNSEVYQQSLWKKALQPLSTAALVLVAISFVFGPLRTATMSFRVFSGILVGLSFKYMQDLLSPMSLIYGFDPALATLTPIAVSALVGIILLKRAA